jgi:rfaE bifunctional protein kinase chain/domain
MNFSALVNHRFREKTIVVVGDLVADQFLRGTISRVSREAPVFILRHDETETLAGGAANAATNIAALGARAVLIGVVGTDKSAGELLAALDRSGVDRTRVTESATFSTTTKIRVLAGQHYAARQQVIRIDFENKSELSPEVLSAIRQNLAEAAETADAIVVSDYNYGAADGEIGKQAVELAKRRSIPLIVDSRFRLGDFAGATTATPNQDEVEKILGADFDDADCEKLRERLGFGALLVTRGNQGMLLVEADREPQTLRAIGPTEPVDVTGAGDTVIAVYSLGLACGLGFAESANLANHAGGIVVMKKGTASVSPFELLNSLNGDEYEDH